MTIGDMVKNAVITLIVLVGVGMGLQAFFGKWVASIVVAVLALAPVLWDVRRILQEGINATNWTILIAPVSLVAGITLSNTGNTAIGLGFIALYGAMVGGIYGDILRWLQMRGMGGSGEEVIKGARIVDAKDMQRQVWAGKQPPQEAITLGGITIPPSMECQHFLIGGTTGAGKTQAINEMLRTARRRGNRAIISDTGCGFLQRFYREGDTLLNPFDARSVAWSPFAEIKREYECANLAEAVIPEGTGDAGEWHHYARNLLTEVLLAMWKRKEHSVQQLMAYLTAAPAKELAGLLAGTPAAILCEKGNEKMLSNTRGIISTYMGTWRYLPEGGTFSIREWVRDETRNGWLYLSFKEDQFAMLKNLVTTWIELGFKELLSIQEDENRRLFFVLDELDTLGKLTALRAGTTKARRFGGVVVAGLQTTKQLEDTWGEKGAKVLLSCLNTKVILRAGDNDTAKYFENEIGQQDVDQTMVNYSVSDSTGDGSTSFNTQRKRQSAVMASEIMALPDLHGYMKIPGNEAVATFALEYVKMPNQYAAFEERDLSENSQAPESAEILAIARG